MQITNIYVGNILRHGTLQHTAFNSRNLLGNHWNHWKRHQSDSPFHSQCFHLCFRRCLEVWTEVVGKSLAASGSPMPSSVDFHPQSPLAYGAKGDSVDAAVGMEFDLELAAERGVLEPPEPGQGHTAAGVA